MLWCEADPVQPRDGGLQLQAPGRARVLADLAQRVDGQRGQVGGQQAGVRLADRVGYMRLGQKLARLLARAGGRVAGLQGGLGG